MIMLGRHVPIQNLARQLGQTDGIIGPADLCCGTHERADLVRQDAGACAFGEPSPDDGAFLLGIAQYLNAERRAVEHRYGIAVILVVSVDIGHCRASNRSAWLRIRCDVR